jgi:hypothetical protein
MEMLMRALIFPAIALIASMVSPDAHAQKKSPGADAVRYFTFDTGLMDDLTIDGILKETRQGGRVVSAVLDVCFPASDTSSRKDRFVVNLNPGDRGRLVGSGETQEDKAKVSVNLTRKQTGSSYSFEGTIKVGSNESQASATEATDQSEQEYREALPEDVKMVATPTDFTEVSPDSIAVKIKRDSVGALVKALRGQDVSLDFLTLAQDCTVLRAGQNIVQIQVDPARAAAVIAKVKDVPGVSGVGYSDGGYSMDLAVRIPAANFRGTDGKLDHDKLAKTIADSAEKALSAKLRATKWDATTGEFTLELARADETVSGVDLTEVVTVTGLVGPEKPGADANLVVWLAETTSETIDGGAEPQVKFTGAGGGGDEESQTNEGSAIAAKLAEDLKGRTWDADKSAWK